MTEGFPTSEPAQILLPQPEVYTTEPPMEPLIFEDGSYNERLLAERYGLGIEEASQVVSFGQWTGTVAQMLGDKKCPVGEKIEEAYKEGGLEAVDSKFNSLRDLDSRFVVPISETTRTRERERQLGLPRDEPVVAPSSETKPEEPKETTTNDKAPLRAEVQSRPNPIVQEGKAEPTIEAVQAQDDTIASKNAEVAALTDSHTKPLIESTEQALDPSNVSSSDKSTEAIATQPDLLGDIIEKEVQVVDTASYPPQTGSGTSRKVGPRPGIVSQVEPQLGQPRLIVDQEIQIPESAVVEPIGQERQDVVPESDKAVGEDLSELTLPPLLETTEPGDLGLATEEPSGTITNPDQSLSIDIDFGHIQSDLPEIEPVPITRPGVVLDRFSQNLTSIINDYETLDEPSIEAQLATKVLAVELFDRLALLEPEDETIAADLVLKISEFTYQNEAGGLPDEVPEQLAELCEQLSKLLGIELDEQRLKQLISLIQQVDYQVVNDETIMPDLTRVGTREAWRKDVSVLSVGINTSAQIIGMFALVGLAVLGF